MKSHSERILSLILALVLSFSLCSPVFAASGFSDVPVSHWAYNDIQNCVAKGIVTGFSDGSFRPNDGVTYAQLISMLSRTFYENEIQQITDTAGKPWYYPYMQVARNHSLDFKTYITRYGGWPEVVVADYAVNRYEMASILRLVLMDHNKSPLLSQWQSVTGSIKDYNQIPAGDDTQIYYLAVPSCYYTGVLTGMSDGAFHGEQTMTRAQACAVMIRLIDCINGSTPTAPVTPTTPTQPEQPQQPIQYIPSSSKDMDPPIIMPVRDAGGKLSNGKEATVENVMEIMAEIQEKYPTGLSWTTQLTDPDTYYYRFGNLSKDVQAAQDLASPGSPNSLLYACGGFAAMVSDTLFGQTGAPPREVTDYSQMRPGDLVFYVNQKGAITHVAIIYDNGGSVQTTNDKTGVTKTAWRVQTCSGNSGQAVSWPQGGYEYWYELGPGTAHRVFTRYPN